MKVILLQDVKALGKKGETVEVSEGYARNFLLPKKLGALENAATLNTLKLQKANAEKVAAENLAAAKELAERIQKETLTIKMKAGEGEKLFGSVSSKEIADSFKEQTGVEIDKKKLVIAEPIKAFGKYEIPVKLHKDVTATLKLTVVEM